MSLGHYHDVRFLDIWGGFGALGYFAFGEETKDMIMANLGVGWVSTMVF